MPDKWLRDVCFGCLQNAGCHISLILQKQQQPTSTIDTLYDDNDDNNDDDNVEQRYTRDQKELVGLMEEVFDCHPGGIDFNILIPALLLLQKRSSSQQPWHKDATISTQSLLCFLCDLAGKPHHHSTNTTTINHTEWMKQYFVLDGALAMKQCGMMENVMAGANLIGGHEGLVLQCVDILMNYAYLGMNEAESLLLYGQRDDVSFLSTTTSSPSSSSSSILRSSTGCGKKNGVLMLTEGHKRILWLLETYVLSIEKYGDLDSSLLRRGKVNPDFAARICLRAWLSLNLNGHLKCCGPVLSSWLYAKLNLGATSTKSNNQNSKHNGDCHNRLACAVLARVLLWPSSSSLEEDSPNDNDDDDDSDHDSNKVLAEWLDFDPSFLIALSFHCCGMVESVPPPIADDIFSSSIRLPNEQNDHHHPIQS
uniref:Uncharacterized protein n=1 Tax=Eucampia antarctica TaxID=49252 RepID=A0A7S2S8Q5_9STRA